MVDISIAVAHVHYSLMSNYRRLFLLSAGASPEAAMSGSYGG